MAFDVEGARAAGYSDAEIAKHLADKGMEPSVIGSTLRGVVRGATFGFGDELRAGTDALAQGVGNLIHGSDGRPTMGQAYDTSLAASREQDRRDVAANPVSNFTGQLAGGAGSMLLAPELGLARLVGRVAAPIISRINPMMEAIPGWLQSTGRLVAGGAAAGGVAGFGEGEGLGDRAGSAITGALTGAAVAPVVGAVTTAAPVVGGRLSHAFGWRNPETAADRQIVRALDRSGVSVDEAATRLSAAGDNPTALVDVGGRNVVNLGATAANTPGASMEAADQFVQGRRIARPDRMATATEESFGGGAGTDIAQETSGLRAQRSETAGPHYDRAFKIETTPDEYAQLAPWVNDRIGQDAMQRGLRVIELEHMAEREPFKPEMYGVKRGEGGDFVPIEGQTPNMRLLDAVKRGYDQIVEGFRDKTSGRLQLDEYGRAVDQNRRAYRDTLAGMFPPYRRALEAWSGPSAQLDALQAGQTALRTNRDIVADRMTRSPNEQEAYRLGAGRDVTDRTSDPARASDQIRKMLEDRQMQARLGSILGPEGLDKFNIALQRETGYTNVERSVSPRAGAQTARLTAGGADMATDVAGPVVSGVLQALGGHPVAGVRTFLQDWGQRRIGQGINPATADALANRLFSTDQAGNQRVTEALRNRLMEDQVRTELAQRFVRPVIGALAETGGSIATRR